MKIHKTILSFSSHWVPVPRNIHNHLKVFENFKGGSRVGSKAKYCNFQGEASQGEWIKPKKSFLGGVCVFSEKRHPAPRGKPQMKSLGTYAPPLT